MRRRTVPLFHVLIIMFAAWCAAVPSTSAEPGRWEKPLSGPGWRLAPDREAAWRNDPLFAPPVDLSQVPVNEPTGGWETLSGSGLTSVAVPGTVEEYFWSANGNHVGTAGDYRGVSWWTTEFELPAQPAGKRIFIDFDSVNLRAEVYLNETLVGYDMVGNTPFSVEVTDAAIVGGTNRLAVRITDPGGNFSWPAHTVFSWGGYTIPIVRGFGGITGGVTVRAVDAVTVDDIFVENTPAVTSVNVHARIVNSTDSAVSGRLGVTVHEYGDPSAVLYTAETDVVAEPGASETVLAVDTPDAEPWGLLDPHLYTAEVAFASGDGAVADSDSRRFGYRWFEIGEKDGDARLYLNGERVFIMAAVNRGYWPTNGIYATEQWARKDVETAIEMGYNAIAFHNAIGHPELLRLADEYGLLCTGESGGYRINDDSGQPVDDQFTRALRREKLFRFVRRDRSSPALIAYMLKNEDGNPPDEDDRANMAEVRRLDPSRILLYDGDCDRRSFPWADEDHNPLKLFYTPLDDTPYYSGWFDMHHWNPVAGYMDGYYNGPDDYLRLNLVDGDPTRHVPAGEVIFYGEEGAFGTMLRLGAIADHLERRGSATGWREREHIAWHDAYNRFLDDTGFRASFPTVDAFTLALGETMHYFHGRIVENCRISNVVDAYNLNG